MPKKDKARKKKTGDDTRQIVYKEVGQMYAVASKMLGGCNIMAKCEDGKERLCHIRGKLRNSKLIRVDDMMLISIREFEPDKADIILGYTMEEARRIKKEAKLTMFDDGKVDAKEEDENEVEFDDI